MAKATTEVLVGTGTLYTAPFATAFPVDPTVAPAAAWIDIGYSEEGWSFNAERTIEDIEVAEEVDPIDVMATKREVHLVGQAAQGSLDNLKIALGGGTITTQVGPPATRTYVPPATDELTGLAVLFRGKAPSGKVRDVRMPKGLAVGAVEMASKKAPDKTLIAIDFRIVKVTGSDVFTIVETT